MEIGKTYELAVIGAGPAGSSAARRAAQLGIHVLLLEKQPLPRIKICAGAVSEQALGYLGFPVPDELIDWECFSARVNYLSHTTSARLDSRIAVLVRRERFDQFLVDKALEAGAELRVAEVTQVTETKGGLRVATTDGDIKAEAAIIALGSTGRLIEKVRRPDAEDESGIGVECRLPVGKHGRFANLGGLMDIYFGLAQSGYGWVFHHGSFCSVGIGGLRSILKHPIVLFHEFCKQLGLDVGGEKVRGHPIPRGGIRRKVTADRMLLAGDAAGFVDPFLGEGIAYAIRSGQLAAETMANALRSGNLHADALSEYSRRCDQKFGKDLRYALLLSKLLQKFPSILMTLLASKRTVLERFIEGPLKLRSYRGFICWLALRGAWH